MPYQIRLPGLSSVRGTHHSTGSDFFYFVRSGTDTSAGVYRLPIRQAVLLSESYGATVAANKTFNLNGTGGTDLQWLVGPTRMRGQLSARILPIPGATSLESISPEQLVALNWASVTNNNTVNEAGTSTSGSFYAVRIPVSGGEFNYVKLRVYNNGVTRLDWVAFLVGPNPIQVSRLPGDWSDVVVSDYESTLFVSGVDASGTHGVLRLDRSTAGSYPQYDGALATTLNSRSISNPRQMVLDGDFVYVVDDTSLWRIDALTGDQVEMVNGLTSAVGLLLRHHGALLEAYISDAAGDVRRVNLLEFDEALAAPLPALPPLYSIGGQSGFMTWASDERTAILVAEQTAGRILRIDLDDGMITEEATDLTQPWGVEVIAPVEIFVASDAEIGVIEKAITVTDVLLLGIGLVPFDYIVSSLDDDAIANVLIGVAAGTNDGRANTSSAPGYYFSSTPNIPFGGNLSLQINHGAAWDAGFRYMKVRVFNVSGTSRTIESSYVNMLWDGTKFAPVTTSTVNGRFPIRDPDALWYNHFLGAVIPTTTADNGHNVLRVEFFETSDASELPGVVQERLILVDNTRYNTSLQLPRLGTDLTPPTPGAYSTLGDCGNIGYDSSLAGVGRHTLVAFDFAAWHPQGVGQYTLRFYRGGAPLSALTQVGDVTVSPTTLVKDTVGTAPFRIGHLTGDCTIASIQVNLTIASRVIDGFGWVNLGSHSQRNFTLAPSSATGHTAWSPPA